MITFPGAGIFWTTLAVSAASISLMTLVGRAWAWVLPVRLQAIARFYLSPVFGLATLTIIASWLGRALPLGNSLIVPLLVIILLAGGLALEQQPRQAFFHAIVVSVFGLVCGVSLLAPLLVFGAHNTHNDAFTYLVHGNWLQDHAFGDVIPAVDTTPLTTQVKLYQMGFRMGASYLMALLQALLNLRWSYEVYPGVIISMVGACCLAIGFPLARSFSSINRGIRLVLLALPAFSLGGLIFGANLGFLPQTAGLAIGSGLIFLIGPSFRWIVVNKRMPVAIVKMATPGAILFASGIFSYPEFAPFLSMALIGTGFVMAWKFRNWKNLLVYMGTLFGLSVLILNAEMLRVFQALKVQTGAVVGSSVDWSLLGYWAHALGLHGGAWDIFQWTHPDRADTVWFVWGAFLSCLVMIIGFAGGRSIWRLSVSGILMPVVVMLFLLAAGTLYFRYAVPSPFPKGTGQSWSQFKLAEWAHPFTMILLLAAIIGLKSKLGKFFNIAVVTVSVMGVVIAAYTGVVRIRPLMNYYDGIRDLNRFYFDFRNAVHAACPSDIPVYLNLGGRHHKFRQMALIYLPDRFVKSDWMDDGYIFPHLPGERRTQVIQSGDCVVEPISGEGWLNRSNTVGPFRVGVYHGQGQIVITSTTGAYDRESDGNNWWHWVAHQIIFQLQPQAVSKDAIWTKIGFLYGTRGDQTLTLRIHSRDGTMREILLPAKGESSGIFEKVIDIPPNKLVKLSIETDGQATVLSQHDPRVAAWLIRNLSIIPMLP